MTVSSTTTKNSYSGDGSNTVFAYTFKVFDEDDLTVILRTDATGTETVQTITTNYTVSGVGDAGGGNVTFVTAPASGVTVVIRRAAALTQTTDYTPNDPFPAEEHENALDKLTFFAQQQQEELDRAIKLSRTNTMTSTEFTVGATDRANKILAFDGTGELSVTQELGVFRGDWTADTAFAVRDLIKDTTNDNIYICQTAHTSSGSLPISTNTDASAWELIVDAATATTSATNAAASAAAAATSETNAATSETNAATSATNAAASEAGVAADASAAAASATAASASETAAAASETAAAASETAAASSATSATASATTATTKAAEASTSASNAATSETNAATSAASASSSATAASGSATNAATSETNAATSAASASTSASNAATSETNAATSASNAATSASNASTSETNAAASATSAASSASTATTQATNAATSASNASTSETNAATSETNAATSATNAASSATSAASSASSASSAQTAAESARDATLAAYDNFDDRYLGAKSSAPTVDNDGNALVAGALYFDTVAEAMYVYTGSSWVAAYVSGTGFLALTGGTMTGDINYGDSVKAVFGAGSDLQIYHDGLNSYVEDTATGSLILKGADVIVKDSSNNDIAKFLNGGAAQLRYAGGIKLATTATGCDITGVLTSDGLTVDGDAEVVTSTTATNMSDPMLRVSGSSYTAGGVYGMGFHYTDDATNVTPTFIGYKLNSGSGNTNGHLVFGTRELTTQGSAPLERMRIGHNGDVSLYADDGTTQGFYWDASTQYLGLGTTGPSAPLHINGTSSLSTEFKVGNSTWNSSTGSGILHQYRGSDGYSELQINSTSASGSNVLTIRDGSGVASALYNDGSAHFEGNVGIGTASVDNKLHLENAGTLYLQIENTSTANKFYLGNSGGNAILESTGAYSMNFKTNGSEAARIDSSGSLMAGKTATNIANDGFEAHANNYVGITRNASIPLFLNRRTDDGGLIQFRKDNSEIGTIGTEAGDLFIGTDDTGLEFVNGVNAILPVNGTTGADRDNAIDLGISSVRFKNGHFGGEVQAKFFTGNGDTDTYMDISSNPANTIKFYTGGSERARLTSGGEFLLGQTSTANPAGTTSTTGVGFDPSGYVSSNRNGGVSAIFGRISSDGELVRFTRTGSAVGSVSVTTTGTTYNTTSDLRLKENIEPLVATDKLMAMNPVSYNWKADPDGPRSMGFIAQEMQEVMPEAVSADDDEDAMMSMDYGRITPILVSALQDAHRKIEQLEQRIADMEAK